MKSMIFVLVLLLLLLACFEVDSFQPLLQGQRIVRPSRRTRSATILSASTTNGATAAAATATASIRQQNRVRKRKRKKSSSSGGASSSEKKKKKVDALVAPTDPLAIETWRVYGVPVHPDALAKDSNGDNDVQLPQALKDALQKKLRIQQSSSTVDKNVKVVRRSLDARKKLDHPVFNYVVDISLTASERFASKWREHSGRMERLDIVPKEESSKVKMSIPKEIGTDDNNSGNPKKTVVVVGMGPAGLFCALQLALKSNNTIRLILLDRGQPVEKRGRDIGALMHRRSLDSESNFAFGEGGAGTWSDGKLTTRIGRNSDTVRWVLELLVEFGAPSNILWEGAPHLGTDNLVRLLRNMRHRLEDLGGEIHFGTKMTDLEMKDGKVCGVKAEDTEGKQYCFEGDAFVLATGHSARDVYESLHEAGVELEAKGFSVGFRIEHPQTRINQIQYGDEWGPCVKTGKGKTDTTNKDFFGVEPEHASMPVPSYRLATDQAEDGTGRKRGVYSFCMCPGGQIVPSSTDPNEICVNGMSFSRRDSLWANSALVVTVSPDDDVLKEYQEKYGVLAGLEFQREMERRASKLGGGNLTVPVQRMTDFCNGIVSTTIPSSSYRLGVKSAACHEIYPKEITTALRDALINHFKKQMPGYYHPDGLLHAVETRTSSPLRISRDTDTLTAVGADNLYPSGEGAGFAGGIVSAAVDGVNVAESILDNLVGTDRPDRTERSKSIGFSY